jgi:hypothetical protein
MSYIHIWRRHGGCHLYGLIHFLEEWPLNTKVGSRKRRFPYPYVSAISSWRVKFSQCNILKYRHVRGCNQKFPDWVDNEIHAYNNKHSLRSNAKVYGGKKLPKLTHKIAIQLRVVAESCTICNSRSKWRVRKLLDTPSYILRTAREVMLPQPLRFVNSLIAIGGCIQKFPDWPPGARTANGTALCH